ncbi:FAD-dependent oxidoreductase [Paenibacillus sanguinis]|uniref:FAD-dependent oxidoreductase n=1 Tax=Paenibacillus sanguinis TaxID=225906 RepID=UPI0003787B5A|nr:FAD-dependent oxidoreductase [Paenibacillus sanguinis]
MKKVENVYDVIVIGSGGAGLRAALASAEKGAKVLVLTKGEPQRSGGTLSAHYSFCAVPPVSSSGDTPEQFAEDIIRSSEGISDPSLVRVLTEQAYHAIAYAEALGVKFDRTEEGDEHHLGWLAGHTHARAFHAGNVVGRDLTRVLMRRLTKQQVDIHAFTQVLQLHVHQGLYKGLFAYHLPTDELRYYASKAVVIATGGGSQLYELNTNPVEATGDGYSLALQAGLELVDMEFVQFYPTVLVAPKGTRGLMFNSGIVIPRGATIKNARGEDVWERNGAGDLKQATRDTMSRVMAAELAAGYGTEQGGLIVDASAVDDSDLPQLQQQLLTDLGVDGASKRYEVAPGAHYFMGGIRIHPWAGTSVSGVFAAGECTGGLHGANRLAGNALSENQVFGAIAGYEAARYALSGQGTRQVSSNSEIAGQGDGSDRSEGSIVDRYDENMADRTDGNIIDPIERSSIDDRNDGNVPDRNQGIAVDQSERFLGDMSERSVEEQSVESLAAALSQFQARWGFVFDQRQAAIGSEGGSDNSQVHKDGANSGEHIHKHGHKEGNIVAWTKQLKSLMQRDVGVNRSEVRLRLAFAECEAIEAALCSKFTVTHSRLPYNRERMKAIELRHMLLVAKAVIYSALERRESRGAHNRADAPGKRPEYQASIAVSFNSNSPRPWSHTWIAREME